MFLVFFFGVFFYFCFFFFFFFSSRRRHTRSLCDWSSDVCSSDLPRGFRFVFIFVIEFYRSTDEVFEGGFVSLVSFVNNDGMMSIKKAFRVLEKIGRASCRERV